MKRVKTQTSNQKDKNLIYTTSQNKDRKDDKIDKKYPLERENEQSKEKNPQQEREIKQLKEKNSQQEREIKQLKEKNSQQEREIKQLKEKNSQQEREIKQSKEKNSQQEREIKQLKEKNSQQEREIKQLKEKNSQLINRKEKEDSQIKKQVIQLEEENERIKKELQKSKSEKDKKTDDAKVFQILSENEIENLEKIDELGSGGGGRVFKVFKKEVYALKEMNAKDSNTEEFRNFINEYEIMSMLNHANILKAYGIFLSNEKIPACILLEFCPYNLQKVIKDKMFSNEELVKIIYQIAEGMKYIHFKNVIHRDLKPTNILIMSDGTVKICDFGISKLMTIEEQTMTRGIGSQKFMAPEIINEEDYYDEKVDVYSFGVLVFFIMTGGLIPKIKMGDILRGKKAEIPSSFTNFAKKLISDCWNFEPKDRPSFSDIVDNLDKNHYNLFPLEKSEVKNVELFVKQHKENLPKY